MGFKKEARFLGIDDSPFDKYKDKSVLVVGTVFRGGDWMDGVLSTKVKVDGSDSTKKLIEMINNSKFRPQLHAIMLDGIALGGFNVVDVEKLHKRTNLPVIVVIRDYPDFRKIINALVKLKMESKIRLLRKAGEPKKVDNIYIQYVGTDFDSAKSIVKLTATRSFLPEPVRIAHIIAAGIATGESKGRA